MGTRPQQTVGQVKLIRGRLAGLSPGKLEMTIGGETMHPRVAIPVGDIQVALRVRHHLRGIVKGPGSAGHQVSGPLTARIRVDAMAAQHLNGLPIQGIHQAHGVVPVREVHGVVRDRDPVGKVERTVAPGTEKVAVPVEDDDGWGFALEAVDPVLGVRGNGADHGKRLSRGELRPVLDDSIRVLPATYGWHKSFLLRRSHSRTGSVGPAEAVEVSVREHIVAGITRSIIV